jgi:hypothetical protein
MSIKTRISFYCYFLLALSSAGTSLLYLLTPRIMPYHEAVIGVTWEELKPGFRLMLLSYMKCGGALGLAASIAFFFLLMIPFRTGEAWSKWAIAAVALPALGGLNYVSLNIALKTSAHPPLIILFISDALLLIGFLCSLDLGKARGQIGKVSESER